MSRTLVVDIGGTTLRVGAWSTVHGLVAVRRVPTPKPAAAAPRDEAGLLDPLLDVIAAQARDLGLDAPAAVGVAFAGPVDPAGRPLHGPTIWGDGSAGPVDLPGRLRARWPGVPVRVVNDVTAAGFRYRRHPTETFCVVTVSSGVGHKVFVHGQPAVGPGGRGGELGHLRVDWSPDAPRCDCGGIGHLGAVASGRAVPAQALRLRLADPGAAVGSVLAGTVTAEDLAEAFPGDPGAVRLVDQLAQWLGRALAGVHVDVGVERFVLIGGLALALGPAYARAVARAAAEACWATGQDWGEMVTMGIADDDAGLIGLGRMLDGGGD